MKKLLTGALVTALAALSVNAELVAHYPGADTVYGTFNYGYPQLTNTLSIGLWVKNPSHTRAGESRAAYIAGNAERFGLLIETAFPNQGRLQFVTECGSVYAASATIHDGNWHYIMGTFDATAGEQKLYVDGECASSLTTGITYLSDIPTKAFSVKGACNGMSWTDAYNNNYRTCGSYGDLSLWNRALSPAEVAALANGRGLNGDETGLVSYWSLAVSMAQDNTQYSFPCDGGTTKKTLTCSSVGMRVVDDPDYPLIHGRCVATPAWCAAHGITPAEDATGRGWRDPMTNVALAVSRVAAGERLLFAPGTYPISATLRPRGNDCTWKSFDPDTGLPDAEHTVLDGQGQCRIVYIDYQTDGATGMTIDSLTFTNAYADNGSAIYLFARGATLKNCIFTDNRTYGDWISGAVGYHIGDPVISNCVFRSNVADKKAAALGCSGGGGRIIDCLFTNNYTTTTSDTSAGGAVAQAENAQNVKFTRCTFVDCDTAGKGGMVHYKNSWQFTDCVFTGGCGGQYGGAVYSDGGSGTVFRRCKFLGLNSSRRSTTYGVIHAGNDDSFIDCEFAGWPSGVPLFFNEKMTGGLVRQSLFRGTGGTLFRYMGGSITVENCTFATTTTFADVAWGTSVDCFMLLRNSILPLMSAAVPSGEYNARLTTTVLNSLVKTSSGAAGNSNEYLATSTDPAVYFKDPANGDYRLKGSKYRDKGILLDWMDADAKDHAGNPRLTDSAGKANASALPDLGCYECQDAMPGMLVIFR